MFDESAELGDTPIGQVPSASSRGVYMYVWRSVHGVVACGPTAEEVDERTTPPSHTDDIVRDELCKAASRTVPSLRGVTVADTYAGLRPGSDVSSDFQVERVSGTPYGTWITVGGIRSTGLTGSLGIGCHVGALCSQTAHELMASGTDISFPYTPSLSVQRVATTPIPPVEEIVDSFRLRRDDCVTFGEDEMDFGAHYVSHPLTRLGLARRAGINLEKLPLQLFDHGSCIVTDGTDQ